MAKESLLSETYYSDSIQHLRSSRRAQVDAVKNEITFRQAACVLARLTIAECDNPDVRALRAIEGAEQYCAGLLSLDALQLLHSDAEDAAWDAVEAEQQLDPDPDSLSERIILLQSQAYAAAYTCATACTLRSHKAAFGWALKEAQGGIGIRQMIDEAIAFDGVFALLK
ncbi:MAG TPA: hypothetical protein VL096_15840 [Pirellulaceae bacterium]|nr:hypothetical protein [Pirellulaceae bacterium]